MTELFSAEYGIKKPESIIEAIRFCATMNENTVNCVIKAYETRNARAGAFRSANIKPGSYEIYFSVLQKDESKLSMGDLGFVKPCRLVCDANGCRIVLRANEIKYRLTEIENAIYRLAMNIKKTQKRANALQNITIPMYESITKEISDSLEEKEREEHTRLKMIKKTKL